MIWLLLVLFQVKHFLCDFPLQGQYMLGKFKRYPEWILPLTAHSGVHALFTLIISAFFVSPLMAIGLALFDGITHFIVDRIKASPDLLGRFQALTKKDFIEHDTLIKKYINVLSIQNLTVAMPVEANVLNKELNELEKDWKAKQKSNVFFWWSLGADQGVHHLTHYLIIAMIVGAV